MVFVNQRSHHWGAPWIHGYGSKKKRVFSGSKNNAGPACDILLGLGKKNCWATLDYVAQLARMQKEKVWINVSISPSFL